jgi:hypothetical protein
LAGPIVRSSNLQFFLARADQAWSALAEKAQRGERLRTEDQQRKAAEAASNSNEDKEKQSIDELREPTRGTTPS